MSAYLQQFAERFARLDGASLDTLDKLYSDDVTFRDPLHQIQGLQALRAYFEQLYANATDIRYAFTSADEVKPGQGYLRWTLQFATRAWRGPADHVARVQLPALARPCAFSPGLFRRRCPAL